MTPLWYGDPIDFGDQLSYKCHDGFYFEEDRDKETYAIECLPNGKYDDPEEWPTCLPGNENLLLSKLANGLRIHLGS